MNDHRHVHHVIQHLSAENDNNGNPRRVYVVYAIPDEGQPEINDVFDEGYGGHRGVPAWAHGLASLPSITITVSEYREWMDREEHLHGKFEVVDSKDGFVWHRFDTRARALRFRRERGKGEVWAIKERLVSPGSRGIGR